jgi:aspartate/methionine/tyrosine aminotransferase
LTCYRLADNPIGVICNNRRNHMRSSRLPADLSVNATTRTLEAIRRRGIEVIDLTTSNPTDAGFRYPPDVLRPLSAPEALRYDPHPLGMWKARGAVAGEFARRGIAVRPDEIALTASTSEAYAWLFKLLCDPGDNVLIPRPSYPLFEHLTVLEAVESHSYHLEYHEAWRVDVESVRDAIDERSKAVVVVSPNNPTGSFLHRDDLAELDDLCDAHNLTLIGDEVFADYRLAGSSGSASVLEARRAVACSLGGLSKTCGLPQIKLGWIAFAGPTARLEALMAAYELIADTYLSVSTPAQVALADLLVSGAEVRGQIQERISSNWHWLQRVVAETPAISLLNAEAGWSAILQVPAFRSEETLVLELLTQDHVLVHPGFFFDFAQEAFLVVSLLVPPEAFKEGMARVLARASQPGAAS